MSAFVQGGMVYALVVLQPINRHLSFFFSRCYAGIESGNPSGPIEGLTSFRSVRFLAEVDRLLRLDYVTKHFIRCIRPAATSTSEEFDNDLVARQLKYMNIVPATARLRNSFVFRLRYKVVVM